MSHLKNGTVCFTAALLCGCYGISIVEKSSANKTTQETLSTTAVPGEVTPVNLDGVRYEVLRWGKLRDFGQNGGLIAAYDSASGDELWVQRIYKIDYGDKSPQKYDVFIRSIVASDDGASLRITDDSGRVFRLRLADRDVRLVKEPLSVPNKPHPKKPTSGSE